MDTDEETTKRTRTIVEQIYAHYVEGQIEQAAFNLADDVDWAIMAPRHLFSFAGSRRGRDAVLEAFQQIARDYEFLSYQPKLILADGASACVYSRCVVRHRKSGNGTNMDLCAVMTLGADKVSWFREFVDSAGTALALSGGTPTSARN